MLFFALFFFSVYSLTQLKLLHVTDIHFNPVFDPSYPSNWCQPPDMQPADYETSDYYYGMIGCNPPITLIDAFFTDAKQNGPYDVIVASGDICSHELTEGLHSECMQVMMDKFKTYFGETPIVFSMGNNDTPSPFNITCSDPHFTLLYNDFSDYIPENQESLFKQIASYSVTIDDQLFISINTNLIDELHTDDCGMLDWLADELASAEENGQHAIIVGHIPPGVASYDGKNHMDQTLQNKLFDILTTYADSVNSILLGHVHRDEFRLLPSGSPQCMLIGTSISPVYSNNPGYRIYTTTSNRVNGFLDYTQFTFDLQNSNAKNQPVWLPTYSFIEEYDVDEITTESLIQLSGSLFYDITKTSLYRWRTVGFYDQHAIQIKCAINCQSTNELLECTNIDSIDECIGI
ncbi:Sphingomyelin phosphodiesterase [Entamoeba marina]